MQGGRDARFRAHVRRMAQPNKKIDGAVAVLSGELLAAVLGFVATVWSARLLGVAEFGRFGIAAATVALLGVLLDVRIEDVAARRYQEVSGAGQVEEAARTWSAYFWSDLAFGAARAVIIAASLPIVAAIYSGRIAATAAILTGALAVSTADSTMTGVLNVLGRQTAIGAARGLAPAVRLVLVVAVQPTSAVSLAVLILTANSAATVALLMASRDLLRGPRVIRQFRAEWPSARATIVALSASTSFRGMTGTVDQLIVGGVGGEAAVGTYRLAKSVSTLPVVVSNVMRFVYVPEIVQRGIDRDVRALLTRLRKVSLVSVAIGVLALAGWAAVGRAAVSTILGSRFPGLFGVTAVLLLATLLEIATSWSKILPVALDRPRLALVEAAWYGVGPVVVTAAMASAFGVIGAAWSMVVISGSGTIGWVLFCSRLARRTGGQAP
jgi:O-antigen/teichoic acid export membrane protein